MFKHTFVFLGQSRDEKTGEWGSWVEVRLHSPRLNQTSKDAEPAEPGSIDATMREHPEFKYWGRWLTRGNSKTKNINDNNAIGGSSNAKYKIWRWAPGDNRLYFTEIVPQSSADPDVNDVIVLRDCYMDAKGLKVSDGDDTGAGEVLKPSWSGLFNTTGKLTWDPQVWYD